MASRPVATALVLLALFAHAFFVSATHVHRVRRGGATADASASVGQREDVRGAPTASDHAQCLLCRFQRNVALGLRHSAPALIEPRTETFGDSSLHTPFIISAHLSRPSGRAPPSA